MPALLERHYVLDLPVDALPLERALDHVVAAVRESGPPMQIVTLNAEMAMQALQDPELAAIIKACRLVVPDGSGVVWALRRQGAVTAKVAGVELVLGIAARSAREGLRLYFLGAQPGVAKEAVEKLGEAYPGMTVAGVQDGYFSTETEPAILEAIREARPDVLFVALGVPRQEKWIAAHQFALGVPVAMGVGGSFDVFAGRVRRAPSPFRRLHLEWLFRLWQEPWRFERMRSTLPAFAREVLRRGRHPAPPIPSHLAADAAREDPSSRPGGSM